MANSYTSLSRTQFSPTNSLLSIYLYLTSIIKYVIYWPLSNSINLLLVRNRGDKSCWLRIRLVTNQFGYEVSSLRSESESHTDYRFKGHTSELGYDGPLYDRFLHMTDNMLGPSPMHIQRKSDTR